MTASYEIQTQQRSRKWTTWCARATKPEIEAEWRRMPSVRRKARCRVIADGRVTILARYTPPELEQKS